MGGLLSYCMVSGGVMMALFLAYRLFLSGENQHVYNRSVLLCIYAVSFSAWPVMQFWNVWNPDGAREQGVWAISVVGGKVSEPAGQQIWGTVLIWVFIAGMVAVSISTLITWLRIAAIIRRGEKSRLGRYTLVETEDLNAAPFSWMNYIVLNREDNNESSAVIKIHELRHMECRHWIDLLAAQAVCIINWFNPAAWLMKEEIKLVHEFQADLAVIQSGHDAKEYQLLLIKKAVGARFPSLANSLNHSKLKKRITMMYKEKSGAGRKMRALALVPMFALALGAASVPGVRAAVSTISNSGVTVNKSNEIAAEGGQPCKIFTVKRLNNFDNKTTIKIKGENLGNNLTVTGGKFTTAGKTYEAKSINCQMADGSADIILVFPFTDKYENSSLNLTVNGEEILFDLEKFFENKALSVTSKDKEKKVIIVTTTPDSLSERIAILLDGKRVSADELQKMPAGKIASITIVKKRQTMSIETEE